MVGITYIIDSDVLRSEACGQVVLYTGLFAANEVSHIVLVREQGRDVVL